MAHYKEIESYRQFTGKAEMGKAINTFLGLLDGIAIDGFVDEKETLEVQNWYQLHRHLIDRHPFSEILPAVDAALSDQVLTMEKVNDLRWLCQQLVSDPYYDLITSAIQSLHGVLHGILADNELTYSEIAQLQEWLDDHSILKSTYPFDEIQSLVHSITENGVVTENERDMLRAFFAEFVDTTCSYNLNAIELEKIKEEQNVTGICAYNPRIKIRGCAFCFTGKSTKATRDEIADLIRENGGRFVNSISSKVDYLIVGADGNPCWAFACYGRKIEEAIALRKKGCTITIVNEHDFWNALEGDTYTQEDEPADTSPCAPDAPSLCEITDELANSKELAFFESIRPLLETAIAKQGSEPTLLAPHAPKTSENPQSNSSYTSVYFGNFLIFRIRFRKKLHYLSVSSVFREIIPEDCPQKRVKSEPNFIRVLIDAVHPAKSYIDMLTKIAAKAPDLYPKEYDCCSRFLACSDAKGCVCPDKVFALGCGYRKILNSGRIFYGKNRNIDELILDDIR